MDINWIELISSKAKFSLLGGVSLVSVCVSGKSFLALFLKDEINLHVLLVCEEEDCGLTDVDKTRSSVSVNDSASGSISLFRHLVIRIPSLKSTLSPLQLLCDIKLYFDIRIVSALFDDM